MWHYDPSNHLRRLATQKLIRRVLSPDMLCRVTRKMKCFFRRRNCCGNVVNKSYHFCGVLYSVYHMWHIHCHQEFDAALMRVFLCSVQEISVHNSDNRRRIKCSLHSSLTQYCQNVSKLNTVWHKHSNNSYVLKSLQQTQTLLVVTNIVGNNI